MVPYRHLQNMAKFMKGTFLSSCQRVTYWKLQLHHLPMEKKPGYFNNSKEVTMKFTDYVFHKEKNGPYCVQVGHLVEMYPNCPSIDFYTIQENANNVRLRMSPVMSLLMEILRMEMTKHILFMSFRLQLEKHTIWSIIRWLNFYRE